MSSFGRQGRDAVPSSSQGEGSAVTAAHSVSMEDQLLEEREHLRNELHRVQGDHRKAIDLLRSTLEKELEDANTIIAASREEMAKQVKVNQEAMRLQELQIQKNVEYKNALTAMEEQNSRLTTEKSNLVVLLNGTQNETGELRGTIAKQSLELSEKFGQFELLKMKISSKESEIEFLKISEKALRSQTEQLRADVSALHGHLLEKDQEISRVREADDQRLRHALKEKSDIDEKLWQERRNVARVEENLRQEQERVQRLQNKESEFVTAKLRLQQDLLAQTTAHQQAMEDLRKTAAAFKSRNEQLEGEKVAEESYRTQLEQAYTEAVEKVTEDFESARGELSEKTGEMGNMRKELESARELLAYLKNDPFGPISPDLRDLVRGQGFSVPRLYHEYKVVVEKLTETEKTAVVLKNELDSRNQEWREFSTERQREDSIVSRLSQELDSLRSKLQRENEVNAALEEQGGIYRRNLRMIEQENKTIKAKSDHLYRQLVAVLDGDAGSPVTIPHGRSPVRHGQITQFRNTQELVEVNLGLYSAMEALSKENFQLKEKIEASARSEEEFQQAAEQIRSIVEQKENFDGRMTELSRELQLYRVQTENPLFKDFLRSMSASPEKVDSVLSLAGSESAMFAFIRAQGGNDIAEKFALVQRETSALRQEIQDTKAQALEQKTNLDRLFALRNSELQAAETAREQALNELSSVRNQLRSVKTENENYAAQASRDKEKAFGVYERLCESEKEVATLTQTSVSLKEQFSRLAVEHQTAKLENSTLIGRIDVLNEQQTSLQNAINQQMAAAEARNSRENGISKDLQAALQDILQKQMIEASLRKELDAEKQKLEKTSRDLADAKKQLEDLRIGGSRPAAPSEIPASSNTTPSRVGSDFALNIIRQSSVQQENLQQRVAQLQAQLEKSRGDLLAKTAELEVHELEAHKRAKEMTQVKTSMLTDIQHIKEDREALRGRLNDLQTVKAKLSSENAKLSEENRRKTKEISEVTAKYMAELQTHQSSVTAVADLRKDLDQTRQIVVAAKRREQELQKALEESTTKFDGQEKTFREEIRLLEQERENAQGWKRALYDQARPPSTSLMTDEVQDLTILVEHQKKESESIAKQLQLAKEEGFANAAKVRSLTQTVSRLQEELQLVMQKQDTSSSLMSWQQSYSEQQTILAATMEVNGKLRTELSHATAELHDLKGTCQTATKTAESLVVRLREVEQDNLRLTEESRTLRQQLETWNAKFGVNQQKDEIESLKKQLAEQSTESEKKLTIATKAAQQRFARVMSDKTKKHETDVSEIHARLVALQAELSSTRDTIVEKVAEVEQLTTKNRETKTQLTNREDNVREAQKTIQSQRLEIQQLRSTMADLRSQLNQAGRQKAHDDTESVATSPVKVAPPKSTAVVTPQTQITPVLARPTGVTTSRVSHNPPVAAVAPQAQEQITAPPSLSRVEPVLPVLTPADVLVAFGEQSEMAEAPSGSAAGVSNPAATAGSSKRPPTSEGDGSESSQAPQKKRARVMLKPVGPGLTIQLRPPSPTSMSDVTSSTAPAVTAPSQVTGSTSDGSSTSPTHSAPRSRAVPLSTVTAASGDVRAAVGGDVEEVQPVERSNSTSAAGQEDGAVDSSAEVVQPTVPLTEGGTDDTEMISQEQMIADEVAEQELEMEEGPSSREYVDTEMLEQDIRSPVEAGEAIDSVGVEEVDNAPAMPSSLSEGLTIEEVTTEESDDITSSANQAEPYVSTQSTVPDQQTALPIVELAPEEGLEEMDNEMSELLDDIIGRSTVGAEDAEEGEISEDDELGGGGGEPSEEDADLANQSEDTDATGSDQASSGAAGSRTALPGGDAGTGSSELSLTDIPRATSATDNTIPLGGTSSQNPSTTSLPISAGTRSKLVPKIRPAISLSAEPFTTTASNPTTISTRPSASSTTTAPTVPSGSGSPQRSTAPARAERSRIEPPQPSTTQTDRPRRGVRPDVAGTYMPPGLRTRGVPERGRGAPPTGRTRSANPRGGRGQPPSYGDL